MGFGLGWMNFLNDMYNNKFKFYCFKVCVLVNSFYTLSLSTIVIAKDQPPIVPYPATHAMHKVIFLLPGLSPLRP